MNMFPLAQNNISFKVYLEIPIITVIRNNFNFSDRRNAFYLMANQFVLEDDLRHLIVFDIMMIEMFSLEFLSFNYY